MNVVVAQLTCCNNKTADVHALGPWLVPCVGIIFYATPEMSAARFFLGEKK